MELDPKLDLQISRLLKAPRERVWQAWRDPAQLAQWWCPKPWTTEVLSLDLRPGGAFHTLMRGPNGETSDNPGSFLAVDEGRRIVFTASLLADWRPAPEPWMPMTAYIAMADEEDGTRYVATVLHRDAKTCAQHAEMGFYDGWNTCIDQLDAWACAQG